MKARGIEAYHTVVFVLESFELVLRHSGVHCAGFGLQPKSGSNSKNSKSSDIVIRCLSRNNNKLACGTSDE
jgi:hypothetical protein